MKITVLDKIPITDIELIKLQNLGELTYHSDYCENHEERLERAKDADILVTSIASKVSPEILSASPNLKFISQFSTGFDSIDIEECTKRGIKVSNVPDYCSATLSEFVFSMIINLTRDIFLADKHVEEGGWDFALFKGVELRGKKIGIIGAGSNGAAVIRIAQGYGMKALVYTHNPTNDKAKELGIPNFVSLEQLLKDSDFITVHVPLNKQTFHMLGENEFKQMKPGVYFINTARGAIVDSNALYSSLENERLAGVALDVLEESEPIEMSNVSDITRKIVQHPRSIVTPHIAFCSEESMQRLSEVSVGNIEAFLKGEPRNIVN